MRATYAPHTPNGYVYGHSRRVLVPDPVPERPLLASKALHRCFRGVFWGVRGAEISLWPCEGTPRPLQRLRSGVATPLLDLFPVKLAIYGRVQRLERALGQAQDTPKRPFGAPAGVLWACLSSRIRREHRRTRQVRALRLHVFAVTHPGIHGISRLCVRSLATSRAPIFTTDRIRASNVWIHTLPHTSQRQNIIEHRASTHVHWCVVAVFRRASVMYAWCHT